MKFLDLFSGIGGIRLGMERAGHEAVGFVEWDKYARQSYKAMFDTTNEWSAEDINKVTNEEWQSLKGKVDIITAGFPCQTFSIAGKRKGFMDQTKGTMFFEVMRAAKIIKPTYIFLENVKGLLNHDKGNTIKVILSNLNEIGYNVSFKVLNSINFGVPQKRERVYILATTENLDEIKLDVNENSNQTILSDILEKEECIDKKYYIDSEIVNVFGKTASVKEATKLGYKIAEIGDSINISQPKSKTRRGRVGKKAANTLLTQPEQCTLTNSGELRMLTPRECWRLQAFPDELFNRAQQAGLSDSQLYKQAGNSVTVNVIECIGGLL